MKKLGLPCLNRLISPIGSRMVLGYIYAISYLIEYLYAKGHVSAASINQSKRVSFGIKCILRAIKILGYQNFVDIKMQEDVVFIGSGLLLLYFSLHYAVI